MTIGDRIREFRKSRGLTQKELGERLGLSYQAIAQWENNLRKPKTETIIKIACALGIRYDDLVGLETFDTGAEFDARWKELTKNANGESMKIIHTTDPRKFIDFALDQMNEEGKIKVAERAAEVLEVPKYRKDAPEE